MRTITDWLVHLLWRAEEPEPAADGLQAWLAVGDVEPGGQPLEAAAEDAAVDLVLQAEDGEQAAAMLEELGRLETLARVVVLGADGLAPEMRRRLARTARAQRQRGLWVTFAAGSSSTSP